MNLKPPALPSSTLLGGLTLLVGGFNPFDKNLSQIGHLPQVGVNIKKIETTTEQHPIQ